MSTIETEARKVSTHRMLARASTALLAASLVVFGSASVARARTVHEVIHVIQNCTSNLADGTCQPPLEIEVRTSHVLKFRFQASADHCTPLTVDFSVSRRSKTRTSVLGPYTIGPGDSTAVVNTNGVRRGTYTLVVDAADAPGGCAGPLSSWAGDLFVTTSRG